MTLYHQEKKKKHSRTKKKGNKTKKHGRIAKAYGVLRKSEKASPDRFPKNCMPLRVTSDTGTHTRTLVNVL